MSDFTLRGQTPDEEQSAEWDRAQREGRKRLLEELEAAGVPRYRHSGKTKLRGEAPLEGRKRLAAWYHHRNTLFGFLLDKTRGGLQRWWRFSHNGKPEELARLLRRWDRRRARWIEAGCPKESPPWKQIEEAKR